MIRLTNENQLQALKFREQADVRTGLVGEWKLDGNLLDSSGNGNNGTFDNGTPNYVAGRVGKCVSFTGSQYISTVNKFNFNSTDSFSISFWFKSTQNTTAIQEIIGKRRAVANSWSVWYRGSDGLLECELNGNTILRQNAQKTGLMNSIWYYITFIYTASNLKMYVNGVYALSSVNYTDTGNFNNNNFLIGIQPVSLGNGFVGSLDEVRLYNRALTTDEITTLYNTQLPKFTSLSEVITEEFDEVITDGLVAYYELNGNTKDSVGTNDGIVGSDAGLGISNITFVDGVKNKCANFPYTNKEYIEAEPVPNLGTNGSDITVCCWIKRTGAVASYTPLVEQGSVAGSRCFRLIRQGNVIAFGNDTVIYNFWGVIYPNTINVWYFVTATVKNNIYSIYINGIEGTKTQYTNSYDKTTLNKLRIGYRPYTSIVNTWNGDIDDVRIYSRALSPEEIKHIYLSTKPVGA